MTTLTVQLTLITRSPNHHQMQPDDTATTMTSLADWVLVDHLGPELVQVSQALHAGGIRAMEWGTGLNCTLGAPVFVFVRATP